MKSPLKCLLAVCFLLVVQLAEAQDFYFVNIEKKVTDYVNEKMRTWIQKGEFENTKEYQKRYNNRDKQVKAYTDEAIQHFMQEHIRRVNFSDYSVSTYDADSESFKITIDKIGDIILNVPRANDKAQKFKQYSERLRFKNPQFTIQNNNWVLTNLDVVQGREVYRYDITQNSSYNPNDVFAVNWEEKNIKLSTTNPMQQTSSIGKIIDSDKDYNIEYNLPESKQVRPDDIAIVIGNTHYNNISAWVDYATNDAKSVKNYLINVLGFRAGNVIVLENATKGQLEQYFGTVTNHKGKLYNLVKPRVSNVFVFYAGHGAPGRENAEPYIFPVDGDPTSTEITGYSLQTFYSNLGKLDVPHITVVIDACFSGTEFLTGLSGVRIKSKNANQENIIVLASSKAEQYSCWYDDKKHGLFTYLFLKSLHDYENTDKNGDKQLTYREIYQYITEFDGGLSYYARRLHSNDQSPQLQGGLDPETVFVKF